MVPNEKKRPDITIDILYINGETERFENIHKFKLYNDIASFEKYEESPEAVSPICSYPILQIDFKNKHLEDSTEIRENTTINFNSVARIIRTMKFDPKESE